MLILMCISLNKLLFICLYLKGMILKFYFLNYRFRLKYLRALFKKMISSLNSVLAREVVKVVEEQGIDPCALRMQSARSTI